MRLTDRFDPIPGAPHALAEGVAVVLAPNPSPMTERGTNSYILGAGDVAVIDPGPDDPAHLTALLAALKGRRLRAILVTHAHRDHSPAARPLAQATGAPVLAFGPATSGRSPKMAGLDAIGGGEGVDHAFAPDETLGHGAVLDLGDLRLQAHHTPGHMGNHLTFGWNGALFTGDQVMGWAPSLVSPPDGDLGDFMQSLDLLQGLGPSVLFPGHGAPVADGVARIRALRDHRLMREAAILAAIAEGAGDLDAVTRAVYHDLDPSLLPAARRNVLAHLIDLQARARIGADLHDPQFPVYPL